MKKFFENIKNIWKVEELRNRILFTLGLILVYRIGNNIFLPGVNYGKMIESAQSSDDGTLETLLSLFSGGGFENASIMALGIMPYISASIIMQLLGMAVPAVQKMQNEGESGRKRINNYTRVLTIVICALQAPTYLTLYVQQKGAMPNFAEYPISPSLWWVQSILVLVAGTMFAVWLGERITDRGIGNGISLLITVGILGRFPAAFLAEANNGPISIVLEFVCFMLVVVGTILIVQGVRKIPLNTAKRVVGSRAVDEGARSYLPIKVNASGVMPIIFAQAIMINPRKIADDLKRSGGFIPGIRPGEDTSEYIDTLVSRITLPGSLFLAVIAILPSIANLAGVNSQFAMFFGGTSVLIMVGVVLDTLQQIESYLLNRHMDGLMEGSKIKGRRSANELSGY